MRKLLETFGTSVSFVAEQKSYTASTIASCRNVTTMRISCGFMLRSWSAYGAIGVSDICLANVVITSIIIIL